MTETALLLILAQAEDAERGSTWWQTIQSGGLIGYLILALSVVALALVIMHLVQIRRNALVPQVQIEEIDRLLARGNVNGAVEYCMNPDEDSYLTRIMSAGLMRFQKSAFGAFEIKNAIEEASEDQTARLYRSTDALGVIGSIAPLLGLLGTVLGMVGAFESLAHTATPNHEQLASNISLALVTTLLGLVLAIPCIALYKYFGNRIDSLASEAALEIERLTLHLESAGMGAAAPASAPGPRPRPVARPPEAVPPSPTPPMPPSPAPATPGGARDGGEGQAS